MENKKKVLLVEDDQNFGSVLKDFLTVHNYQVILATDGEDGLIAFKSEDFDICILDVMLPLKDGFTLSREIKSLKPETPIIFLTAKTMKEDILTGYKSGADDYLLKPFDAEVLIAKLKVVLNRREKYSIEDQFEFVLGNYTFNSRIRELIYKNEKPEQLSPKENQLLKLLILNKNDIVKREQALSKIWRDDNYFTARSMDVYIAKLRKRLNQDENLEIMNIHGEGFRLIESNTND